MTTIEILLIAVGLSMDAFSVAVASGATMKHLDIPNALKMGLFFGGFHTLMPVLGWLIGLEMRYYITSWDHWVAFGLLGFLGGNMIYESLKTKEADQGKPSVFDTYGQAAGAKAFQYASGTFYPYKHRRPADDSCVTVQDKPCSFDTKALSLLSVATSIDAMAVGLTFSMLTVSIGAPAILIGLVVFAVSVLGVVLGSKVGHFVENYIGIFGGLVLISIGFRILIEHVG